MDDTTKDREDSNGYDRGNESNANISRTDITWVNQIDSILSGYKWSNNNLTFSFPTSKFQYTGYRTGQEPDSNFITLNTTQQNAARDALTKWASFSNLNFTETTGGNGTIRFGTSGLPETSQAYWPSTSDLGGDVWFGNSTLDAPDNPVVGNYSYATYVHEIGHALGLKHPHDLNGTYIVANPSVDSIEYSIMSYRGYVGADVTGYHIQSGSYPTGPMMSDIAAIQEMYGANYNYNSQDNVYRFDPNQTKIFQTIWDGGGNDTYDLSAYTTNLSIDLRPGQWSAFGTSQLADLGDGHSARGNVANSLLSNGDTRSLIDNAIGGTGNDTLLGNQVNNLLNGGAGADYMAGGAGNDTYIVDNNSDIVLEQAGEGADTVYSNLATYTLGANIENLVMYGTGNNNGVGNSVGNAIYGNSGNNTIDGGLGADYMVGGAGNDTYVLENIGDVAVENANEGIDTIYSNFANYALGTNLENLVLSGTGSNNGTGNSANNEMYGNSGNNILDGGLGADYMVGGAGNDTYVVDHVGDVVLEQASEGIDAVYSNLATYTLGANVENMVLYGAGNINGVGNSVGNEMYGNSGDNVIDGGSGADYMVGGVGNDTYVVDNSGDVVVEQAGQGADTVYSNLANYTLGTNLENIVMYGVGNSNGVGNSVGNAIYGNSGNNVIDGGLGADYMVGGAGNDTYVMDNVGDVVAENANEGIDTVYSNFSNYALGINLENLVMYGAGNNNGVGNSANNEMYGNSGNNILDGGLGADYMVGGAGNDTYVVDHVGDVVMEQAGEGIDAVYSNLATYTLGANVENLVLYGTGNINGVGNSVGNEMYGNSGDNVIDGGAGADYMVGGVGNDTYVVDNSGDVVVEQAGQGADTVYSNLANYTLGTNLENIVLYGVGNSNGVGNSVGNAIYGNSGNNVIDGGLGADYMVGGAGNDTYVVDNVGDVVVEQAGAGIDLVYSNLATYTLGGNIENLALYGNGNITGIGNELDNTIIANSGNDNLYGGAGNDLLYAGAGNDLLDGGLGNDTYVIGLGSGNQTINSYVGSNSDNGFDTLLLQNMSIANLGFTKSGNDLICTVSQTGKTIDIASWFLGTNYQLDQFQFADGTLTSTQVNQKIA